MTAQQTAHREPRATQRSVTQNGLPSILRTRGRETTRGERERRDAPLIHRYRRHEQPRRRRAYALRYVLCCVHCPFAPRLLPFRAAFVAFSHRVYCPFAPRLLPFRAAFVALSHRAHSVSAMRQSSRRMLRATASLVCTLSSIHTKATAIVSSGRSFMRSSSSCFCVR